MKNPKRAMLLAFATIVTAGSLTNPLEAANGDPYVFEVGQRENGQNLTPVSKYVLKYEQTSSSTCYGGQNWCTKTAASSTKLAHWHNVDSELTSQQKTRADIFIEYYEADLSGAYRISSASIVKTCHSWALGYTQHIVGPHNELVLHGLFDRREIEVCLTHMK